MEPDRDTAPVRPGEELDASALERFLRSKMSLPNEPLRIEQFPGGHSNLTYLLRFGAQEFVLRRPPIGPVAPKAHDMAREVTVTEKLNRVFPLAPRPILFCEDTTVLGVPFYLMERRRGLVVRRDVPEWLTGNPALLRRISEALIDTLASLHAVDFAAAGLGDLGRPAGFVERQVRGWAERWERAKTRELEAMKTLARWLVERIPISPSPTLVHNDFRLDNVMLDHRDPARVVAVFDWEMCTIGDPLVDLGIFLGYWPEPEDPPERRDLITSPPLLPGLPTRREIVEHYAQKTGRDVSEIAFYETFALYRTAVVLEQIYFRYKRGQTRDERFAEFEERVPALAQAALDVARRCGL